MNSELGLQMSDDDFRDRLMKMLAKPNLFDSGLAESLLPILVDGSHADLCAAAAVMGEVVARQADSLANGLESRGNKTESGQLRAKATLAHADWNRLNQLAGGD